MGSLRKLVERLVPGKMDGRGVGVVGRTWRGEAGFERDSRDGVSRT